MCLSVQGGGIGRLAPLRRVQQHRIKQNMNRRNVLALMTLISCLIIWHYWEVSARGQEAAQEVYEALQTRTMVKVVIALRCTTPLTDLEGLMEEITAAQDRVLFQLEEEDFTLVDKWVAVCGLAGEVSLSGLEKLLGSPDVVRVDLDKEMKLNLNQSVPLINADDVQNLGFTGDGVTVAVFDTGVDTDHPDLSDDLVAQQCFCQDALGFGGCPNGNNQQSGPGSAEDDDGHGTHVTGIITSRGTIAPRGVAPDAKIVAIKILGTSVLGLSCGLASDGLAGLDWLIDNLDQFPNLKVVNASLGFNVLFNGTCDNADANAMMASSAIRVLKNNGVISFAASGNDGSSTGLRAPACFTDVVSVGAVYDSNVGSLFFSNCSDLSTAADKVVCFSNSNNLLDLLAPGALITSTGMGGGSTTLQGTSQASPHAAGAAAVLLEANPELTPDEIKSILKNTGKQVTDTRNGLSFPRIDLLGGFPQISVTPNSLDFGNAKLGEFAEKTFAVENSRGGTLIGSASTSAPFSIVAGGSYNLTSGASQNVTLRFTPTAQATTVGNVTFTGAGGVSRTVTGIGISPNTTFTLADLKGGWSGSANSSLTQQSFSLTLTFNESGTVTGGFSSRGATFTGGTLSINSSSGALSGTILGQFQGQSGSCTLGTGSQLNAAKTTLTGSASCTDGDQITSIFLTRQPVQTFTLADMQGTWSGTAFNDIEGALTMTISFGASGNVTGGSTSLGGIFTGGTLSINSSSGALSGTILEQVQGQSGSCTLGTGSQLNAAKTLFTGSASCTSGARVSAISLTSEQAKRTLTVKIVGSGDGTVTGLGIKCGTDCQEIFNSGTSVTLTANPADGSTFAGFSGGGCSGTGPCSVTVNVDTTVTATFNRQTFTLTVDKGGSGDGTVTGTGINCGTVCSEAYASGTSVTLTANPSGGSTFKAWSGACSGTGICTVTMTADRSVTATYSKTFTDDPLTAGTTIKAVHPNELRQAVDNLRAQGGLGAFLYTDPNLTAGVDVVKAIDFNEIITALTEAATALGQAAPNLTPVAPGDTVRVADIQAIRIAIRAVESLSTN